MGFRRRIKILGHLVFYGAVPEQSVGTRINWTNEVQIGIIVIFLTK